MRKDIQLFNPSTMRVENYGYKPASKPVDISKVDWAYSANKMVWHDEQGVERSKPIVKMNKENFSDLFEVMVTMAESNHHIPEPFHRLHSAWMDKLYNKDIAEGI